MKLSLRVDVDGLYFSGGACVDIPEPFVKAFEPLRITDDSFLAYTTGECSAESLECRTVTKLRETAAKEMAEILTQLILGEMKRNDTLNGYKN